MPKYRIKPEDNTLFDDDVLKMLNAAKSVHERVLLSLCWLFGPRPAEIATLTRGDIAFNDTELAIRIVSLKRGSGENFDTQKRTLIIPRVNGPEALTNPTFPYIETIINRAKELTPETRMIPYTKRWMELTIAKLGMEAIGKPITPYHLRHSRITCFSEHGMSDRQIQYWKGAKDLRSVQPYVHARPQRITSEILSRTKDLSLPS